MDRIDKFLLRLPANLLPKFVQILLDIRSLNLRHLDVKKMQGYENRFRVRVGKYRIIFEKQENIGVVLDFNTRGDIY